MVRDSISEPLASASAISAGVCAFFPQASCQDRSGFTLIELLVVIAILGILSSALVVSVQSGYKQARQANCKSNLRQFGVALTIWRGENDNQTPDWLSNLYPDYVDDRAMYVCRADRNGGRGTPRPEEFVTLIGGRNPTDTSSFWDNEQNSDSSRNRAVTSCSYLYEFSGANTPWRVPSREGALPAGYCMRDYKMDQMTYGDDSNLIDGKIMPYSASRIPIIRCYHHWRDQRIYGYPNSSAKSAQRATKQYITLNVAYAGNVFVGPPWWEGTLHPGETRD
ncbi:MAG: type II secretion system protein [Kiritimatiellia bacterium]|jgi:prepilin-type N-terminal cleavage/methylation domain-containing protein|nr:type II secretion system protein [Kiritimatiellia bacterium]